VSWNYRIVQYADGTGFGLHEVYYNEDGTECAMTDKPAGFVGDSPEEIRGVLMMARADANKRPVFVEPDEWAAYKLTPFRKAKR